MWSKNRTNIKTLKCNFFYCLLQHTLSILIVTGYISPELPCIKMYLYCRNEKFVWSLIFQKRFIVVCNTYKTRRLFKMKFKGNSPIILIKLTFLVNQIYIIWHSINTSYFYIALTVMSLLFACLLQ